MIKHILKNGTQIEITTREYCGHITATTSINGKYISGIPYPPERQIPETRKNIKKMGYAGYWTLDCIILPAAVGSAVLEMITSAQAALDATPERQLVKNINEREDLLALIRECYAEVRNLQERSFESGEGTGKWVFAGEKYQKEAEKYRIELKTFELAHPEVIAEIEKRKEEAHQSFLRHD